MNLLAAALYDPAVAVTKSTTAGLAMTAIDTSNLQLNVTVPAHGMVMFRLGCMLEGATTFPQILLGVLSTGGTVIGRVAPMGAPDGTALATTFSSQNAEFIATGLTPGATKYNAAYGVETVVALTGIKYGGPNNTTANDAFGAFQYEAWDPQPQTVNTQLLVDASGRVDVSKVAGTTQTARDLGAQLDATVSSRMATYTQPTGFLAATFPSGTVANTTNITAGTITTATNLTNAPTAGDFTATMKTSLNAATPASVTGAVGSVTGAVGSVTGNVGGSVGSVVGLTASNLDATVSSRLAAASYTAPDNTGIGAIQAKTDSLTFTVAGHLDANTLKVNGVTIIGDGSGTPFNV